MHSDVVLRDDEATRRSIDRWTGLEPDEKPVFWLALAAAQSRLGRLDENVRRRALAVIDSGADLVRWRSAGPEVAADRSAVLDDLREELAGPQRSRKTVRRPWREVTDLDAGMVLAWTASNETVALLRVVQRLQDDFDHSVHPVLERLSWTRREVPSADVLARLPAASDFETRRRAVIEGRSAPGIFIPFKLERRHPGWADLAFTVCDRIPSRPGDEADWLPHASFVQWDALPDFLDGEVVGPPGRQ